MVDFAKKQEIATFTACVLRGDKRYAIRKFAAFCLSRELYMVVCRVSHESILERIRVSNGNVELGDDVMMAVTYFQWIYTVATMAPGLPVGRIAQVVAEGRAKNAVPAICCLCDLDPKSIDAVVDLEGYALGLVKPQ